MLLLIKYTLLTTCFTLLVDYIIQPGQILGFYGRWLQNMDDYGGWRADLAYAMGRCYVCFNFWTSLIFCILLLLAGELNILDGLTLLGVSHVLVQIIYKHL